MPTARPGISARTGVASLRLNTSVSAYGPAIPTPTPTSAFSSVIPAATGEPKVPTRTMAV